jgi:crotonobetainyl-CoA:carnitine CoA-transferase CaiB-like acyl-CoA transferase
MLADLGADVVWVEPPGGDPLRLRDPAAASVFGRGKRSITVDLTDTQARDRVSALGERADIFVGGMADQVGHRDGPVFVGFPFASIGAAYLAVIGIPAALRRRNEDRCRRRICTITVTSTSRASLTNDTCLIFY